MTTMPAWVAALPLLGFFLALMAYWCWTRAREAATDADLQRRLWEHNKYQRDYEGQTPLENAEQLRAEQRRFQLAALGLGLVALGCFGAALLHLGHS